MSVQIAEAIERILDLGGGLAGFRRPQWRELTSCAELVGDLAALARSIMPGGAMHPRLAKWHVDVMSCHARVSRAVALRSIDCSVFGRGLRRLGPQATAVRTR